MTGFELSKKPRQRPGARASGATRLGRHATWVAGSLALIVTIDHLWVAIDVLTPHGGQAPLSPLYAIWAPVAGVWHVPALIVAIVLVSTIRWIARCSRSWQVVALGVLLAASFATTVAMVRGGPTALTAPFTIYAGEDYTADVPLALDNPRLFLRRFDALMPQLSLHGRTHPPGFTLCLAAIVRILGPAPLARALAVILISSFAAWPLYTLTRRRYGLDAARVAVLLYASTPSIVLFTATSVDALLLLPSMLALDAFDRSLRGRAEWAAAAGSWVAVVTFFSFSGMSLLLVIAGLAVIDGKLPAGARSVRLALAAAGGILPFALLLWLTGFDVIACFRQARMQLEFIETQLKGRGQHPSRDFLYTVIGNLVAWAIGLGAASFALFGRSLLRTLGAGVPAGRPRSARTPAAAAGGARSARTPAPPAVTGRHHVDGLLIGLGAALVVMDLSFLYLLEVERIWMFLMPAAVALAAAELGRTRDTGRPAQLALILQTAQCLLMETLLYTFW